MEPATIDLRSGGAETPAATTETIAYQTLATTGVLNPW